MSFVNKLFLNSFKCYVPSPDEWRQCNTTVMTQKFIFFYLINVSSVSRYFSILTSVAIPHFAISR